MPTPAETLLKRLSWDDLDLAALRKLIESARDEDLAGLGLRDKPRVSGDRSTASLATAPRQGSADLVARETLTACGLPLIALILSAYGKAGATSVQLRSRDGKAVAKGDVLATLTGDPRVLLSAERVILNFIQRLSGIASQTRTYVDALGEGRTRLLDTRKTTPGWRMLEKYAVACGGGWNHRLGLFDRVMLKDNHLALLGFTDRELPNPKSQILKVGGRATSNSSAAASQFATPLATAVARAKKAAPDLPVEVEVDDIAQIPPVLAAGADVILLDNFTPARIKKAVALIGGRAFTEASGGITLKTLPKFAGLGLDFVSTGALVHQSVWVDIGLDWRA